MTINTGNVCGLDKEDDFGRDESDTEDMNTDTEHVVQEAMQRLPSTSNVAVELRSIDIEEEEEVELFISTGCSCSTNCSSQFSCEYIREMRSSCFSLTRNELDMAILGQLMASSNTSDTVEVSSGHLQKGRERPHTTNYHCGKKVCHKTYCFLHTVGKKRLYNLAASFKENGLTPRVHGNTQRKLKHTLSLPSIEYVVRFLLTYSEQNALLLPGRIPGYSRSDIKLLPSSASKRSIWRVYRTAVEGVSDAHSVAYTTFCRLWRSLLPSVIIMKPMSDLCWQCQQNSTAILRATNCTDSEKSETLKAAEEDLRIVQLERSFYRSTCDDCRREVRAHFSSNGSFHPPPLSAKIPANSNNIKVHYSFDYARQVHFPSDALQPGPIYFLTPRKCTVFGINCKSIPRQVNVLTDEAGECGKGANNVISRLHYFFEMHGLGEKVVYLHADICTGQNKNNCMIHYLVWRALTNRHSSLTLSFLVVGHTKFSPDWCFGLFKRRYRRTKVGSLTSIAQVVNDSAECNFAQLVSREDGSTIVPTYNWTDFFAQHLKKIVGMKNYHHFRCMSSEPGVVYVKEQADTPESKLELLKTPWSPDPEELPHLVHPRAS